MVVIPGGAAGGRISQIDRGRRVASRLRLMPGALARDPASARHAAEWTRSLFFGNHPLGDEVPWLPFKAREWLRRHVGDETTVFEYGCGGSTLFLAKAARSIVSVEHDRAWSERVRGALSALPRRNWVHHLREPEPVAAKGEPDARFVSARPEFGGFSFERYVTTIDDYADGSFDVVIVDGRARLACIERALPKVREGGHLVLDNAERPEYASASDSLAAFPRLDLRGLAPYRTYHWQTTVWQITR